MPTLSPSSLSVYEDRSRPKGLTASGARRPLTPVSLVLQTNGASADECPGSVGQGRIKTRQVPADDRRVVSVRKGLILAAQIAVLVTAVAVAFASSTAADWEPVTLVALLFILMVGSDILS